MSFQQFLQSEIAPQRTVAQPDSSSLFASAAGTALNVFSAVQERGMENEFAGEVQRIINLNEELVSQNIPLAKRTEKLRQEISSSFSKDPQRNLELRKTLASYGVGAGLAGTGGRGGMGASEAPIDQKNADIESAFGQIPSAFSMMYVDFNSPGGITIEAKQNVIEKYQKYLVDQTEGQRLMSIDKTNQAQSAMNFGAGSQMQLESTLSTAFAVYENTLNSIDLKSPTATQDLERLRINGIQTLAIQENKILSDYAEALAQMDDKDAIAMLDKNRDAQLAQIKSLRDNFFSPDSDLDILKQSARYMTVLTENKRMNNADAVANVEFFKDLFGESAFASIVQTMSVGEGKLIGSDQIESATQQIISNLENVNDPEAPPVGTLEDSMNAFTIGTGVLDSTVGVSDPKIAETGYAIWASTSQRFLSEGAHPQDLQKFVDKSRQWESHWKLLPEEQQEAIKAREDTLIYRIALDPSAGPIAEALDDNSVEWDFGTMQFVPKAPKKLTGVLQVGPTGAPVSSVFSQVNTERFDESMKNVNRVKAGRYNKRLEEIVEAIIRKRKRESKQELTREQAIQLIRTLPRKQ